MSDTAVVKSDPRVGTVRTLLEQLKPQMKAALPAHLAPDRMARIVMTQVQNNPYLLQCDRGSLLSAVMTACQLGLEPDGILGHAYLVPFGRKVQFVPGYKGLIKLARNSGEVEDLYAVEVCANDTFKVVHGLNRDLQHVKATGDRGAIIGFYAVVHFTNGGYDFVDLTVEDVNKVRDNSEGFKAFKAGKIKDTPWESHYEAMGRKTAVKRLASSLPLSVQKAVAIDNQFEAGKNTVIEGGDLVITSELVDEQVAQETPEKEKPADTKLDKFAKGKTKAKGVQAVEPGKGTDGAASASAGEGDGPKPAPVPPKPAEKPEPEFEDGA